MMWETSELLHSLVSPLNETEVSIGVNGKLVEKKVAEERGYTVEKINTTLQVSIPYKAEGGYRKVRRQSCRLGISRSSNHSIAIRLR